MEHVSTCALGSTLSSLEPHLILLFSVLVGSGMSRKEQYFGPGVQKPHPGRGIFSGLRIKLLISAFSPVDLKY